MKNIVLKIRIISDDLKIRIRATKKVTDSESVKTQKQKFQEEVLNQVVPLFATKKHKIFLRSFIQNEQKWQYTEEIKEKEYKLWKFWNFKDAVSEEERKKAYIDWLKIQIKKIEAGIRPDPDGMDLKWAKETISKMENKNENKKL